MTETLIPASITREEYISLVDAANDHFVIVKDVTEPISNTTFQNDDDFSFPIAANEIWVAEYMLYIDGAVNTTGDFKANLVVPSGASGRWSMISQASNATTAFGAILNVSAPIGTLLTAGTVGANTIIPVLSRATIRNGATPGTVDFQWAQVTTDAGVPTRLFLDSSLTGQRQR